MSKTKGIFYVVVSSMFFGCMPTFAKFIYASGCSASVLVLLRFSLALPVIFLLMLREGGKYTVTLHELKELTLVSAGYATTPLLLFASYNYIPSGAASTIHFIYPVFVLFGCVIFFKEKASPIKIAASLLCTVGVAMFYTHGEMAGTVGIILAFLSGITFAFYIVYLSNSSVKMLTPFKLNFYISAIGVVIALGYALLTGTLQFPQTTSGWGVSFIFALVMSVIAAVMYQSGIKIIGSQQTAILSTFEPITGVVLGILAFNEPAGLKTMVGVILVLSSVVMITAFDR